MNTNYIVEYIKTELQIKNLKKSMKEDNDKQNGVILPNKIKPNEYIICWIDNVNSKILSFVWFGIYIDCELKIDFIGINYSYTFIKYRNKGLNTKLKILIEEFGKKNKINYIKSVPLENSKSKNILLSLGFIQVDNHYVKKIGL